MKSFGQNPEEMEEFLSFMEEDIENVRRCVNEIQEADKEAEFKIHAKSETVEESASHTNIDKSRIVKTLVFTGEDEKVAVLASGDSRVDEQKLERYIDQEVSLASPSEVRKLTGYIVGGVSPFDLDIPVLIDEKVTEKEKVRPAAGSRVVGVEISSEALEEITNGKVVEVS